MMPELFICCIELHLAGHGLDLFQLSPPDLLTDGDSDSFRFALGWEYPHQLIQQIIGQ